MPSDIEMSDSDSSILDTEITLDPEILPISSLRRVVHKCKEYIRHPEVCAAEAPSVIWRVYTPQDDDSDDCELEDEDDSDL
jgi:hypothetical protein